MNSENFIPKTAVLGVALKQCRKLISHFIFDEEAAETLVNETIPHEKERLKAAKQRAAQAQKALNEAVSYEGVEEAQKSLDVETGVIANIEVLIENLEAKVKAFESAEFDSQTQLDQAMRQVWKARFEELLQDLTLDSKTLVLLENIIAAADGTNPGCANRSLGYPLTERFGDVDNENISAAKQRLLVEMGLLR